MTLARRLAQIERRRLDRAVAAFRRTKEAHDRELARRRVDPEHEARIEARHQALYDALTPEEREEQERKSERMVEAIRLLGRLGAPAEDVDRAVRLLEPLVTPRGSPPHAIVGAIRRAMAQWTAHEEE